MGFDQAASTSIDGQNISPASVTQSTLAFDEGFTVVEDDNSPWTPATGTNPSFTLAGQHDRIIVKFQKIENTSGTNLIPVDLRMNGDTTQSYKFVDRAGARTTGETGVPLLSDVSNFARASAAGSLEIKADGDGDIAGENRVLDPFLSSGTVARGFSNNNITQPLTDFELVAGGSIDVEARVLGVEL